jgi:hypothetical protein
MLLPGICDITKILTEALSFRTKRNEHTRAQLIEFLEDVAKEARLLADTWVVLLAEIADKGVANRDSRLPISPHGIPQHRTFTKLAVFYQNASRVLDGRMDSSWRSEIFDRLAGLMHARNITRAHYDSYITIRHSPILLGGENEQSAWQNIESGVLTLSKEAAALEALVISYKASPSV